MATRGIVLNGCYGWFRLSEEGEKLLIQMGMSPKRVHEIGRSHDMNFGDHDLSVRMDPLLVALVRKHPESFEESCTSLYVQEVPVDAIKADAVSFQEFDGYESVEINWEKVALWKKCNEQPKKFATLEAAIISDAPKAEASKAEVMRLLEEFKKTIPEPMPSKPVPDELPCSDSEDEE